ncbi:DNA repair endonuclease rad2 [Coniochaeta sp. 2T2.1]|nr:DNA repair endonuclease rad2 [Coniochaeta sp. 2T2.1]
MGIKGIYKEIGEGQRKSLAKLAVEHLERTGRPFRLAIDISIWSFQVQAAQGGTNPAIRTLFYRLVRLLGHSIQPLFVFDGPNKPKFKRGKRSTGNGSVASMAMMKRLIRLFGFTVHDAPGEAEAECALLQQKGVVDAVLSEDVDTIMFGCGMTMRSWTSDTRSGQTPTHVTVYDAEHLRSGEKGLDREGMVLVALMSGGDYIPEGIPNCGVKLACEAARAGFGASLCRIKRSDQAGIDSWKDDLVYELRTNEKGFFRTKHKALIIPDNFPNMEVLRYYTHPVVSQQQTVDKLSREFPSSIRVDITGLREFVRETFEWTYREGAIKLVRVLAPSLLVQSLLGASTVDSDAAQDPDSEKAKEYTIVRGIASRRTHFSTDSMPELRVSYVPIDMVPLDLEAEPVEEVAAFGRDGLALNSDDEFDEEVAEVGEDSQTKKSKTKPFDPLAPNPVWIPESVVQLGVPLTLESWQEALRVKELAKEAAKTAPKRGRKRTVKKPDALAGALDKWVKVAKRTSGMSEKDAARGTPPRARSPVAELLPGPKDFVLPRELLLSSSPIQDDNPFLSSPPRSKPITRKPRGRTASKKPSSSSSHTNPWTVVGSQSAARVTKTSTAATSKPTPTTPSRKGLPSASQQEPIVITSSPLVASSPAVPQTRMTRAQQPTLQEDDDIPSLDRLLSRPPAPTSPPSSAPAPTPAPVSPKACRKPTAPPPASPAKRTTRTTRSTKSSNLDALAGLKQASITNYIGRAAPSPLGKERIITNSDAIICLSDDEGAAAATPGSRSRRSFGKSATFSGPYGQQKPKAAAREPASASQPQPQLEALSDVDEFPHIDDIFGEVQAKKADERHMAKKQKRLYLPSTPGYFEQIEIDEGPEYERMSRVRGAVRVSDVSSIWDLTNED